MHQPPELIDEVVVLYIVSMKVVVCGFCGKERSMTVCPHGVSKKELFLERSKTHRIFNLSGRFDIPECQNSLISMTPG